MDNYISEDSYNDLFEESFLRKRKKKTKRVIQSDMNTLSSRTTTQSSSTTQPSTSQVAKVANSGIVETHNGTSIYQGSSGQYYFLLPTGTKSWSNSIAQAKASIDAKYPERKPKTLSLSIKQDDAVEQSVDSQPFFRMDNYVMWGAIAGAVFIVTIVIYLATKKHK